MKCLFIVALIVPMIFSIPIEPTTENLVVVTDSEATTPLEDVSSTKKEQLEVRPPTISSLDVHSNVTNRFATTLVKSKVKNEAPIAQETTFFIVIPDHAYISGFTMEIGGKNYTAYVQEKEKAKQTYNDAVLSGTGAAHIAVSARDSNKFTVSVNVEPQSKAIFYLTYEELLDRKDGLYELIINIHPNQLVKHMNVEVDINESRPITNVKTPAIRSGNEIVKENPNLDPKADIQKPTPESAKVTFSPDYEQQKQIAQGLGKEEKDGIGGQFVVQYDVERDPRGGEVLLKDGYFVHFFAPSELEPLDKHVVFVLDTSGSMYDRKMDQLKTAMHNILGELKPKDFFNLVEFNTNIKVWNLDAPGESTHFPHTEDNWYNGDQVFELTDISFPPAYPVNKNTIKKANKAVDEMYATGGTNIYEALRVGLHLIKLRQTRGGDNNVQPLIVFLTDGDPTVGKTTTSEIIGGIAEQNLAKVPIISLSFGTGADREFLQKISLRNTGFARHIYEDSDASLQLQNFYKQISSPLLHNIKFEYTPDITSLTRDEFPILYGGAEIVVCGQYPVDGNGNEFNKEASKVVSWGRNGPVNMIPTFKKATGQLERLWAYMTVRKYLDAKEVAVGNTTEYENKALDLAKKYSFVTPVTSLVVVKPNASTAPVDAEAADGKSSFQTFGASSFPAMGLLPVSNSQTRIGTSGYRQYSLMSAPAPYPTHNLALPMGVGGPPPPHYISGASAVFHSPMYAQPQFAKIGGGGGAAGFGGYNRIASGAFPGAPGAPTPVDNLYAAEELDVDMMPAEPDHFAPTRSTTYNPPSAPSTSTAATTTTSTTTPKPVTLPAELEAKMPWLKEQLNPDGSLKFFKGNYKLGFNETSPIDEECTDPKSEEGHCVLLMDCEEIHSQLTSPKTFKDYFCAIDEKFVGVCCAKKKLPVPEP